MGCVGCLQSRAKPGNLFGVAWLTEGYASQGSISLGWAERWAVRHAVMAAAPPWMEVGWSSRREGGSRSAGPDHARRPGALSTTRAAVSYTHLTLPTIYSV